VSLVPAGGLLRPAHTHLNTFRCLLRAVYAPGKPAAGPCKPAAAMPPAGWAAALLGVASCAGNLLLGAQKRPCGSAVI